MLKRDLLMRLHDSIISSSDSFLDLNGPTMDSYSFKFRLILNALSPVKILVLIKSKLMSPKMTAISDFWVFIYHSPPHFDKCFRMPYQCRRVQSRNPFFFFLIMILHSTNEEEKMFYLYLG